MDPPPLRLCRDCLQKDSHVSARCPHCGSPRTIELKAAADLAIAHVDCDAFYAAVEKRDDPNLQDKPVIVGGSGPRAVVATCCYIARTFGVRSAMPMSRARALCPDAVVVPPDMARYARVGREIRTRMMALTPLVEPLSIDEAFLDLRGCEGANGAGAAETLIRFARRVEAEIGVTVSIGLNYCKFLAKLASDLNKPRGFASFSWEEAKALAACGVTLKLRLATSGFERAAAPGLESRSSRSDFSRRRGRCWTPSPTASPIARWGSPQRNSRRPKGRTGMTCSWTTAAVRDFERWRLRACATGSAPQPCSDA
jgi:DNA polymerase IV